MKSTSPSGHELKQLGLDLVAANSGDWMDYIIEKLRAFCKQRKEIGQPEFRLEEFRSVVVESNWELPATSKAWGAVPRVALSKKIIVDTQKMQRATSPATHAHKVAVWAVA